MSKENPDWGYRIEGSQCNGLYHVEFEGPRYIFKTKCCVDRFVHQ